MSEWSRGCKQTSDCSRRVCALCLFLLMYGYINVPETDEYTFHVNSDDKITIDIDNKEILNTNVWTEGLFIDSNKIKLEKNKYYRFVILHSQKTGGQKLQIKWSSPNMKIDFIPQQYLSHGTGEWKLNTIIETDDPEINTPVVVNAPVVKNNDYFKYKNYLYLFLILLISTLITQFLLKNNKNKNKNKNLDKSFIDLIKV